MRERITLKTSNKINKENDEEENVPLDQIKEIENVEPEQISNKEAVNINTVKYKNNADNIQEDGTENVIVKSFSVDKMIQVTSGDLTAPNFSYFIKTDKQLSTATGIPSLEMLDIFIKIVERVAPKCAFYAGKLTTRDRIIANNIDVYAIETKC